MRKFRFRAKAVDGGWVYGDLIHKRLDPNAVMIQEESGIGHDVLPETVGQYTGCIDKNGRYIYEGDIIRVYIIETRGELFSPSFEHYIKEVVAVVKWEDASFVAESEDFAFGHMPLPFITWEYGRDETTAFSICCNLDKYPELTQEDIDNCEFIGNVYDNKNLIEG